MSSIQICTQTSDFANIQSAQNYFGGQLTKDIIDKTADEPVRSLLGLGLGG